MAATPGALLPSHAGHCVDCGDLNVASSCEASLLCCCRMDAEYDAEPEVPEEVSRPAVSSGEYLCNPLQDCQRAVLQ